MCACTEPVRTGIGAVCVEYGRPKWPNSMLNHTIKSTNKRISIPGPEKGFIHYFWNPMLVPPAMKRLFLPEGKKRPWSLRSLCWTYSHHCQTADMEPSKGSWKGEFRGVRICVGWISTTRFCVVGFYVTY